MARSSLRASLDRLLRLIPGARAIGLLPREVDESQRSPDSVAQWLLQSTGPSCVRWARLDGAQTERTLSVVAFDFRPPGASEPSILCAAVLPSRRDSAHDVLGRLTAALEREDAVAGLLLHGHHELSLLERALDGMEQPAFLFTRAGVPLLANRAGQRGFDGCPSWLYARLTESSADLACAAEITPLEVAGLPLLLVAPRPDGPDAAVFWCEQYALPPALARVAGLLAAGRSDREIADRTGLTYNSVRTYVRRIYSRLCVGSRAELARLAYGGRAAD